MQTVNIKSKDFRGSLTFKLGDTDITLNFIDPVSDATKAAIDKTFFYNEMFSLNQ